MRIKKILILFVIPAFAACNKSALFGDKEYVSLSYTQTFYADPRQRSATDSLTLKNLANYLDSLRLYRAGLSIKKTTDQDACDACHCKTGKTIYVNTLNSDSLKTRYMLIGFR